MNERRIIHHGICCSVSINSSFHHILMVCVLYVTIGTVLPYCINYSTDRVEFTYESVIKILGDKVEGLDIFTIPGSILYKAMISSSVLHHNALFFVSVSSVSKESKPSHSLFSILLIVVLQNEKHCIQ